MINIVADTRTHPLYSRPEQNRPKQHEMIEFLMKRIYSAMLPFSQYSKLNPNKFNDETEYLAFWEGRRNGLKAELSVAVGDIDNEENFKKIFTETNRITLENITNNVCVKKWSTIGDMHGSALKFLYFLLIQGAARIENDPHRIYSMLFQQYENSFDMLKGSDAFKTDTLPHIRIMPGALVRSLGDDTGDRCGDEYMMLLLIALLIDSGARLEILLSNHGTQFILAMEDVLYAPNATNITTGTYREEFSSTHRLRQLIEDGVVTLDEIKKLYEKYKTTLKAFSYDYNDAGKLMIYGHGPMNELDILDIAQHLLDLQTHTDDIDYMSDEQYVTLSPVLIRLNSHREMLKPEDITLLIDHINRIVQYNANQNTLINIISPLDILRKKRDTQQIDENTEMEILAGKGIDPLVYGLHYATHNRDNPLTGKGAVRRANARPKNPDVITGHGHTTAQYEHCVCYDNILCKNRNINVGVLNISLTHPSKPDLVNKDAPVVKVPPEQPSPLHKNRLAK